MSDRCLATAPFVTEFVLVLASLCTRSLGWILVTVVWDDIRDRVDHRNHSPRPTKMGHRGSVYRRRNTTSQKGEALGEWQRL
jgi:hypothetical protein